MLRFKKIKGNNKIDKYDRFLNFCKNATHVISIIIRLSFHLLTVITQEVDFTNYQLSFQFIMIYIK